ncbi:hypothetical protein PF672P1_00040 [Parabacteroides phage PF672P1]|nr:hypothetical protein PF672P1_00040 [Parabacteroides phage PF672P1]
MIIAIVLLSIYAIFVSLVALYFRDKVKEVKNACSDINGVREVLSKQVESLKETIGELRTENKRLRYKSNKNKQR